MRAGLGRWALFITKGIMKRQFLISARLVLACVITVGLLGHWIFVLPFVPAVVLVAGGMILSLRTIVVIEECFRRRRMTK